MAVEFLMSVDAMEAAIRVANRGSDQLNPYEPEWEGIGERLVTAIRKQVVWHGSPGDDATDEQSMPLVPAALQKQLRDAQEQGINAWDALSVEARRKLSPVKRPVYPNPLSLRWQAERLLRLIAIDTRAFASRVR